MTSPRPIPDTASVPLAAVRTTLDGLVHDGVLSPDQATQVHARLTPLGAPVEAAHPVRGRVVEVAGYLGGAMVLGGAAAIVVPTWDSFPPVARFLLALVATILLTAAALAARFSHFGETIDAGARMRLASALGALAAGSAAIAAAVPATDSAELLAASLAALAVAVPGYALVRGAPLLGTAWLASAFLVGDLLDRAGVDGILPWGITYAVVGAVWLLAAVPFRATPIREPGLAAALGGLTGFGAAQGITTDSDGSLLAIVGLILGLAFAAGCFAVYLSTRRWPALVPAVLIALVVPATALAQILDSLLAAGFAVVLVGLVLLTAGGVALVQRRPAAHA